MKRVIRKATCYLFYRLKWMDKDGRTGWFLVKRIWAWLLFSPIIIPVFMLDGIVQYYNTLTSYRSRWITDPKRKLSKQTKRQYRSELFQ